MSHERNRAATRGKATTASLQGRASRSRSSDADSRLSDLGTQQRESPAVQRLNRLQGAADIATTSAQRMMTSTTGTPGPLNTGPVAQMRSTGNQAQAARSPVQRVENEALRSEMDVEMDALKARTLLILEALKAGGENWRGKWGEQASKKASETVSDKLNGKESEPIEKQVLKKLWAEIPTEDKIEIAREATKHGLTLFGEAARTSFFPSFSMPSIFGGSSSSPEKESAPEQPERDSGGSGVVRVLNEITLQDAKDAYAMLRQYRKFRGKLEEVKKTIISTSGNIGKTAGEFAGTFRDEHDFEELIAAHAEEFRGASKDFDDLEARIAANKDRDRYDDELNALHNVFRPLTGPRLAVMLGGQIVPEARLNYPTVCADAQAGVATSARDRSIFEHAKRFAASAADWFSSFGGEKKTDKSAVAVEQEKLASAIRGIARANWSPVTRIWSVPDGVASIRKIDQGLSGKAFLAKVRESAAGIAGTGKGRDEEVTQPFYEAIKAVELDNAGSLKSTTSKVQALHKVLESK